VTKLLFRGRTEAEDRAIRGWLQKQGVAVDPAAASVESSTLAKAGVDVAALAKAAATRGLRDGFDLAALERATVAPSAALLDRQTRELSALSKQNLLASVSTAMERLGAERARLEAGEVPSRAELTQLARQARQREPAALRAHARHVRSARALGRGHVRPRARGRAGLPRRGRAVRRAGGSNRGRTHLLGGLGAWREHDGHLNASGNALAGPWGLPAHTKGDLDLSRNAFEDLRAFDLRPIRVDGTLDLSHNPNLRNLSLLQHLDVGGDLILVGIPATRFADAWDVKPKVGGKIVLHPSQAELIEECRYHQLPHRVLEDPAYQPFVAPSDPEAWLLGLTSDRFPKERDLLSVLKGMNLYGDPAVRASLSAKLVPRCRDADPRVARAAIALLRTVDHDAIKAVAMGLAARIPADPLAPAGAELRQTASPLLGLAIGEVWLAERHAALAEDEAEGGARYPSWATPMPKTERIALELVRRAEAGEPVPMNALLRQLDDEVDRARDGDSVLPEAAVRMVAAQLADVTTVKGELRLHTKAGETFTLDEALGEVRPYSSTWDAFERALRRAPHDAQLAKLYDLLKSPGLSSVLYVGRDDRAKRFEAELAVRRAPSPALAGALDTARALSRHTQPADVRPALDGLVAGAPKLEANERVAVLQELVTADVHELRHHPSNDVRVAWALAAGALVRALPEGHGELVGQVLERFREQLTNAPAEAEAAGLDRAMVDVLHAIPSGSTRGHFVALHARALDKTALGRATLTRFFDETIARAGDATRTDAERHEDFTALGRVTGCLIPVITKARTAGVVEGLQGLALGGDLAFDRDQLVAKLAA
jgi:hypothetical protein